MKIKNDEEKFKFFKRNGHTNNLFLDMFSKLPMFMKQHHFKMRYSHKHVWCNHVVFFRSFFGSNESLINFPNVFSELISSDLKNCFSLSILLFLFPWCISVLHLGV